MADSLKRPKHQMKESNKETVTEVWNLGNDDNRKGELVYKGQGAVNRGWGETTNPTSLPKAGLRGPCKHLH